MKSFLPTSGFARRFFLVIVAGALPAAVSAQLVPNSSGPAGETIHLTAFDDLRLPPVVVTATRTTRTLNTVGSAVEVISPEGRAQRQQESLAEALGGTTGSPLFASGAAGATTSLFLRGANSNQTLFLVDGIRLNDANADYGPFLGGATLGSSDTVEIVRGPQSVLYGSEAIGGVVAIRTERGGGPAASSIGVSAGSNQTVRGTFATRGGLGPWDYNLSASGGRTGNDRPNNDFADANIAGRLDRKVSQALEVGATVRWFHGRYGDPGDRYTNDPDDSTREDNLLATAFLRAFPAPGWELHGTLGGQSRRFVTESAFPAVITNRRGVLDFQGTYLGSTHHHLTMGVTAETTQTRNTGFGAINRHQTSLAFFAQEEFTPTDNLNLTAGLRSDDFNTFGRATTGRLTAAWQVAPERLKLRASGGTGFRSPSFLDLYGQSPFYVGNPSLKSEHARGWDAGVDLYSPYGNASASLTWFENRYSDLITGNFTVFPSTVANVARARTRGLEWSAQGSFASRWNARVSYTYLEAVNLTTGDRLLRRPRNSATADLEHDFGHGLSVGAGVTFAADRRDLDARTFATIDAEDYTVARLYAAWQINRGRDGVPALPGIRQTKPNLTLKVRLENLLDEKYEPVNGYPATGFGAFGGVEWRF